MAVFALAGSDFCSFIRVLSIMVESVARSSAGMSSGIG